MQRIVGGIGAADLPGRLDLLLELASSCYLSGDLAGSLAALRLRLTLWRSSGRLPIALRSRS